MHDIADQCSAYQNRVVKCNAMHLYTTQYSTVMFSTVQYIATECIAAQCSEVQWSSVKCSAVHFLGMQCSAVQREAANIIILYYIIIPSLYETYKAGL